MGTAAAVAGTVLATSTPAHATVTTFCTQPGQRAGDACFYSNDDKFKVTDIVKDGLRSVVMWELIDYYHGRKILRHGECHNATGYGTTVTCDYDFPEGPGMIVQFLVVERASATGPSLYPTLPVTAWVSGR